MFLHRAFSSVVLIGLVSLAIFSEQAVGVTVTLLIIGGLYEFFLMLEKKGISMYKYLGIGIGAIIPLSITFHFESTKKWELLFMLLALLFLILMQFKRRKNTGAIVAISTTIFGILYISWFLSFLIKIRFLDDGFGLLVLVLVATKLCDMGSYLVGSRFGRTPLMPRISPKKTVEGAIGGLVCSIAGALLCHPLLNFDYARLLSLGFGLGLLAEIGDLSESLMKRDCEVKDSGSIFPGMGGVLDLVDSLLFTAPAFYFYISIIPR
ncbi:MAG TPA: phosphatidate cytidylyltransferase [Patescibacteria group bacterium]|nr:phosphatidate cytidylyltransferase [Patescibacteria group bacterium]